MTRPPPLEAVDYAAAQSYADPRCVMCRGRGAVALKLAGRLFSYKYAASCRCALTRWHDAMIEWQTFEREALPENREESGA